MRIETKVLQELVNKANKGVGNIKIIPSTSLINIRVKDNVMTLITNNGHDYLYITEVVNSEDFNVVIETNSFVSLINKLTTEFAELSVNNNSLLVKGNGSYEFPIYMNNEGNIFEYPNPLNEVNVDEWKKVTTIQVDIVKTIIDNLKYSLSEQFSQPCYTNYYFSDEVITTNSLKISCYKQNVFNSTKLVMPSTMELLLLMKDTIDVYEKDKYFMFEGNGIKLYSVCADGLEEYKADVIKSLLETPYTYSITLNAKELIPILERISIFTPDIIEIIFNNDELLIKGNNKSQEKISIENGNDFQCKVDIQLLLSLLKTIKDTFELQYGNEGSLKIINQDVIHIVCCEE